MPKKEELDARILAAIASFDGVPTANGLGKAIGVAQDTVQRRTEEKPAILQTMEKRGREYLEGMGKKEFLEKYSTRGGIPCFPEYAKEIVQQRFDVILLERIASFEGVPTARALGKAIGVAGRTVQKRIEEKPAILQTMEKRGREFLEGISETELLEKYSIGGWVTGLPEYAQEITQRRVDAILLARIALFEGMPNAEGLGKAIGMSRQTVQKRIEENQALQNAMEKRGREFLEGISEKEFLEKCSSGGWMRRLPEYAKEIVQRRFDVILLERIAVFDGVPTAHGLGKDVGMAGKTVQKRIEENQALQNAMEKRGREFLEGISEKEFLEKYATRGWMPTIQAYATEIVRRRVDEILLRVIRMFDGELSARSLGNMIGLGNKTVQLRIDANTELWQAYYNKKGLTPDQAIELALERNEETDAAKEVLLQRLRNLHAFREMIGLIRCFGDLLTGSRVLEISLYPEPLKKAADELGFALQVEHVAMQAFRKPDGALPAQEDRRNVAVLQSIHRLASQGLTRLFTEVHKTMASEGVVIATCAIDCAMTEAFADALRLNGFEMEESGIMSISPPSADELEGYGVAEEDVERIQRKMSGESRVLVLKALPQEAECAVPALERVKNGEGNGAVLPDAEAIDVPNGANREISAQFLADSLILPSAPFLMEVSEQQCGGEKIVALLGYDMHPKRRNRIESVAYPDAPAEDYRAMARKLATDAGLRNELGVQTVGISRVGLKRIKQELK